MKGSKTQDKYIIPDDLMDELDQIPLSNHVNPIGWTSEMDAIVLQEWKKRDRQKFVDWFKKRYGFGSSETIRVRYNKIMNQT